MVSGVGCNLPNTFFAGLVFYSMQEHENQKGNSETISPHCEMQKGKVYFYSGKKTRLNDLIFL